MPTYEYECEKCSNKFEVFQGINALHLKECPKCKGKVRRLIGSGAGIIFKGSGFYHTDYKNKPKQNSCPASKDNSSCKSCPASKK